MLYSLFMWLSQYVGPLNVFRYITFRAGFSMFVALVVTIAVGPFFIRQLKKFKLGQHIHEDVTAHQSKAGTPTMGGILIIFGAVLTTLLFADLSNVFIWLTLLVFLGFGVVGLIDDLMKIRFHHNRGLSAKAKFGGQIVVALIGLILLYNTPEFSSKLYVPFFKNFVPDLGIFYVVFGLVVLLSSTNAVNLTDGLDGLAILPVVICLGVYAVFIYVAGHQEFANYLQVAYAPGVGEVAVFCGALMGAGLGFLWYNALPAELFMGDVGSLSLGGVIGFIAVLCKQELTLIIVGGVFIIETLSVILQVFYFKRTGGKRLFLMAPLHHHFELKGWPESKIIVRFWILAVLFAIASLSVLKLR